MHLQDVAGEPLTDEVFEKMVGAGRLLDTGLREEGEPLYALNVDSPERRNEATFLKTLETIRSSWGGRVDYALESHFRNYIAPPLGAETLISAVRVEDLRVVRSSLGEGDLDFKTPNRVLTTLRRIFKFGAEKGYCLELPLPKNFTVAAWEATEKRRPSSGTPARPGSCASA